MVIEHLKPLAVFAKTVELGSFRAAGRALGLSPSVVSHHVSGLERALSLALMYRSTRHLALTPDGAQLYQAARDMVASAQHGLDAASGKSAAPVGALRVTAPAMLAETRFCRDVAAFARAHPNVRLTIGFTEQRRDLLRDGLDLALRIGRLDDSALKSRPLATMNRVLVATGDYVAGRPRPRAAKDLVGWDWIQLSALKSEHQLYAPRRKRPVTLAFTPRIVVDSAAAMRTIALSGLGIASLPRLIVDRDLEAGRLVEVLPRWRVIPMTVYAVWPGGTPRPGLTFRFVEFLAPRLATLFSV